ncbi:MAG: hypothetical protein SEPTF4163_004403 [Sporothrix epigloea]
MADKSKMSLCPVSPTLAERLERLIDRHNQDNWSVVGRFARALERLSRNGNVEGVEELENYVRYIEALMFEISAITHDAYLYLSWAKDLADGKADNIEREKSRLHEHPELRPALTKFEHFPQLPMELRCMIFAAAAQPPACPHYFSSFDPALGGREPSAEFMEDQGLWTACKESRWSVQNKYRKASARWAKGDQLTCQYSAQDSVKLHRQLGFLNEGVVWLFRQSGILQREHQLRCHQLADKLHKFLTGQLEITPETARASSDELVLYWAKNEAGDVVRISNNFRSDQAWPFAYKEFPQYLSEP